MSGKDLFVYSNTGWSDTERHSHLTDVSCSTCYLPELQSSETSGLLQVFEDQSLSQQSNPDLTSLAGKDDSQSSLAGSITPNTSLSHGTEQGAFKKPKKRRTAG
jgi:hypothetical protein